jgi:hypothetical protein
MTDSGNNVAPGRQWCRWQRMIMAAAVGMAVLAWGSNGVRAEDDNDVAPDTKFLRNMLKGLGLRQDGDDIDYRERSPLVLPPGQNLPPPQPPNQASKTAAWPNDPDVRRAKQRKEQEKKIVIEGDDERPLRPSELNRPGRPASKDDGSPSKTAEESARPSSLKELGSKSLFSGNWFAPSEEYTTFAGEPPRDSLTEPPVGYRTPSPNQPYGVGKEKWKPPVVDNVVRETR